MISQMQNSTKSPVFVLSMLALPLLLVVLMYSVNVPESSTGRASCMFSMCLKMVYSKGVFLFPGLYTVYIDPFTCSENDRLCFHAPRQVKSSHCFWQ